MDKRTEFNTALKENLKARDQVAVATIRLILAALKERDITARSQGHAEGITDNEILSLLQSMIKQRRESSVTYREADRHELAEREEQEINIINKFLPQQMDDEDLRQAVDMLITELKVQNIKDMGKVMAELKTRYAGQIDMTRASGIVRERLAA